MWRDAPGELSLMPTLLLVLSSVNTSPVMTLVTFVHAEPLYACTWSVDLT